MAIGASAPVIGALLVARFSAFDHVIRGAIARGGCLVAAKASASTAALARRAERIHSPMAGSPTNRHFLGVRMLHGHRAERRSARARKGRRRDPAETRAKDCRHEHHPEESLSGASIRRRLGVFRGSKVRQWCVSWPMNAPNRGSVPVCHGKAEQPQSIGTARRQFEAGGACAIGVRRCATARTSSGRYDGTYEGNAWPRAWPAVVSGAAWIGGAYVAGDDEGAAATLTYG